MNFSVIEPVDIIGNQEVLYVNVLRVNHIKVIAILTTICLLAVFSFKFLNITKISNLYFYLFILMFALMLVEFKKNIGYRWS